MPKETLEDYFPKDRYKVHIETDMERIKDSLNSKSADSWGQGVIGETGYFKLTHSEFLITVCSNENIQKLT